MMTEVDALRDTVAYWQHRCTAAEAKLADPSDDLVQFVADSVERRLYEVELEPSQWRDAARAALQALAAERRLR